MRPEREANHLPPPNAEVKNGGAIPPRLHMASWNSTSLIKDTKNVNFTLYIWMLCLPAST
jgi:hypothetical protein